MPRRHRPRPQPRALRRSSKTAEVPSSRSRQWWSLKRRARTDAARPVVEPEPPAGVGQGDDPRDPAQTAVEHLGLVRPPRRVVVEQHHRSRQGHRPRRPGDHRQLVGHGQGEQPQRPQQRAHVAAGQHQRGRTRRASSASSPRCHATTSLSAAGACASSSRVEVLELPRVPVVEAAHRLDRVRERSARRCRALRSGAARHTPRPSRSRGAAGRSERSSSCRSRKASAAEAKRSSLPRTSNMRW